VCVVFPELAEALDIHQGKAGKSDVTEFFRRYAAREQM
jgi:hypothetical protein